MAGTSYTRQSSLTDGDTITASLFNDEYNQLVNAFAYNAAGTTGHQHDGGSGEGGNIEIIGDQDFKNRIVVDTVNNRWSVYVEVGGTAVEQVRIEDGVVYPVTDSDIDLGTDAARFKAAYIDSITATTSLTLGTSITVSSILDEDDMVSNSATALATQQSIKAYVDSQVTAQDLDLTDGTTSISIDLDSEALSVLGGTGVTSTALGNGVTLAIDSTVATLTGSQTLTNKTLTTPAITGALTTDSTIDGRDVAVDGTKLDGIEALADVTDTTNVTAAGALMDSELTSITAVKALNQGVATTDSPSFVGLTTSGEITANGGIALGDNDKATFGAGDDLAIYHNNLDGHSYIEETGVGNLFIDASNLRLRDAAGANMLRATSADSVELYYNAALKLATTATGIEVTGTVVADGATLLGGVEPLTVKRDGTGTQASAIFIKDASDNAVRLESTNSNFTIQNTASNLDRLLVANNGDISFYEDTGTTTKFFWNASAEGLAIGHSAPDGALDIEKTVNTAWSSALRANEFLQISNASTTGGSYSGIELIATGVGAAGAAEIVCIDSGSGSGDLAFSTRNSSVWSEKMRIDSAGNVGIGVSAPTFATGTGLQVTSGSFASVRVNHSGSTGLDVSQAGGGAGYLYLRDNADLIFGTNNAERMRIDSAGRVGIGTSSPDRTLSVKGASNVNIPLTVESGTGQSNCLIAMRDSNTTSSYAVAVGAETDDLLFRAGGFERARIDSAGNLLVGKTATALATAGIELRADSTAYFTKDSSTPVLVNRVTTDGDLIQFRKDNTTVGSIGTGGGDLNIGTGDTRIRFNDATDNLIPLNAGNGYRDASISLGDSGARFKDLYLSGTANAPIVSVSPYTGLFNAGTNKIGFQINGQQKAQIDSVGNLLVGTTNANNVSDGIRLKPDGFISAANTSGPVLYANRLSTDGSILSFQKDGTSVGSIGTISGDLAIYSSTTGHNGLRLGLGAVLPTNNTGVVADNSADLGNSIYRFKNIYLSGGVYLGGTGAANKLDDYEEGTWVPTPNVGTFSSTTCSYTKVGRVVTLIFDAIVGTGGGSTVQAPITAGATTAAGIYTSLQDFSAGRTAPTIVIGGGTTTMYFRDIGDNVGALGLGLTAGATITFTLSYITA